MNVVDSSGWLEFFAAAPNAAFFLEPIRRLDELIVPTLCIYEVYKRAAQQKGERRALQSVAAMKRANVIPVDASIALEAANLSRRYRLPMADSLIYATAKLHGAVLWTQDAHFKELPDVNYCPKC